MSKQAEAMQVDLVQGAAADRLLSDDAFCAQWTNLWDRCPWATPFQSPGYVRTFYSIYRQEFEPLLVLSRDGEGNLQGLLALAISSATGRLVGAGDVQAEYQVWICNPELADHFPPAALQEIRRRLPKAALRFHYLPPCTPLGWLDDPKTKWRYLLKCHRRPLVRFGDGSAIAVSLAKRANKNRLRQMGKAGRVELKHITDPAEMEAAIDAIIPFHDVRHMTFRGAAPFEEDPKRKAFALALMKVPGLLHVTMLKAGDEMICAHLGGRGKNEVQLGMMAHNPWFAQHSPGKFQILFLSRMLMQQGYEQLDLTAGGDPYKERYADAWDDVHTLTLYPSRAARAKGVFHRKLELIARRTLKLMRLSPNQARLVASKAREFSRLSFIRSLPQKIAQWIASTRETRLYSFDAAHASRLNIPDLIHRDAPGDLLHYYPTPRRPSRQKFVAEAVNRMEDGQHLYTRVENAKLSHYAWLAERPSDELAAHILPGFALPPDSALILDFHNFSHDASLDALSIRTMLRAAAAVPKTKRIFIPVKADNAAARAMIEQLGFGYEGSLFERMRLGRRRWSVIPPARQTAQTPHPKTPANEYAKASAA
jgi:CelD/BcsL family acetyltransferase involved in cellulose biosynthesis